MVAAPEVTDKVIAKNPVKAVDLLYSNGIEDSKEARNAYIDSLEKIIKNTSEEIIETPEWKTAYKKALALHAEAKKKAATTVVASIVNQDNVYGSEDLNQYLSITDSPLTNDQIETLKEAGNVTKEQKVKLDQIQKARTLEGVKNNVLFAPKNPAERGDRNRSPSLEEHLNKINSATTEVGAKVSLKVLSTFIAKHTKKTNDVLAAFDKVLTQDFGTEISVPQINDKPLKIHHNSVKLVDQLVNETELLKVGLAEAVKSINERFKTNEAVPTFEVVTSSPIVAAATSPSGKTRREIVLDYLTDLGDKKATVKLMEKAKVAGWNISNTDKLFNKFKKSDLEKKDLTEAELKVFNALYKEATEQSTQAPKAPAKAAEAVKTNPVQPTQGAASGTKTQETITPKQGSTEAKVPPAKLDTYVNHSGGAVGADLFWGSEGAKLGIKSNHYRSGNMKTIDGSVTISPEDLAEGQVEAAKAAKRNWGYQYAKMKMDELIRNWAQVKYSDAIFAVSSIAAVGERVFPDQPKDLRVAVAPSVTGGTGYAVGMAINHNKPVYVFNQKASTKYPVGWYTWDGKDFVVTDVPMLTKNFAGIGSRNLTPEGKKAIEAVYKKTQEASSSKVGAGTTAGKPTKPVESVQPTQATNTKEFKFTLPSSLASRIANLFKQSPELKKIGTPEEYANYIASIFPNSQVKNVVYHGTLKVFDVFDKNKRGENTGKSADSNKPFDSELATFFSSSFTNAASYQFLAVGVDLGNKIKVLRDQIAKMPSGDRLIGEDINKKKALQEERDKLELIKQDLQGLTNQLNNIEITRQRAVLVETNIDNLINGVRIIDPQGRAKVDFKLEHFGFTEDDYTGTTLRWKDDKYILDIISKQSDPKYIESKEVAVTEENLLQFVKDLRDFSNRSQKEVFTELAEKDITLQVIPAVLNIQNPSTVNYSAKSFVSEVAEPAGIQTQEAVKAGNDAVIFANITDPSLADNFGVFDESNIHILGNAADIASFKRWKAGKPSEATTTLPVTPEPAIAVSETPEEISIDDFFHSLGEPPIDSYEAPTFSNEEEAYDLPEVPEVGKTFINGLVDLTSKIAGTFTSVLERFYPSEKNKNSVEVSTSDKLKLVFKKTRFTTSDAPFTGLSEVLTNKLTDISEEIFKGITSSKVFDLKSNPLAQFRINAGVNSEKELGNIPLTLLSKAMAVAGANYAMTRQGDLTFNDRDTIKSMLGLGTQANIPQNLINKYTPIGTNIKLVADAIGAETMRIAGLKVDGDLNKSKMKQALGLAAIYGLIKQGYMKKNDVPLVDYLKDSGKPPQEGDNTSTDVRVNFVTIPTRKVGSVDYLDEKVDPFYKLIIGAQSKLTELYGFNFSAKKALTTEQSKNVPKTTKGTSQLLTSAAEEAVKAANQKPYRVNKKFFDFLNSINETVSKEIEKGFDGNEDFSEGTLNYLTLFGYTPVANLSNLHKVDRESKESINRTILRNIQESIEFVNSLEGNLDQDIFLRYTIWTNQRMGINSSSGINPLTTKIARALVEINHPDITLTKGTNDAIYEKAILSLLDVSIEKVGDNVLEAKYNSIKDLDSIQTLINRNSELDVIKDKDALVEIASGLDGDPAQKLMGLVSLINFERAKENDVLDPITLQIDGASNGVAHVLVQVGETDSGKLASVGLYDTEFTGGTFSENTPTTSDTYYKIAKSFNERLIQNGDYDNKYRLLLQYLGGLVNAEGDPVSNGRKLVKYPLIALIYGQEASGLRNTLNDSIIASVYAKASEIAQLPIDQKKVALAQFQSDLNFLFGEGNVEVNSKNLTEFLIDRRDVSYLNMVHLEERNDKGFVVPGGLATELNDVMSNEFSNITQLRDTVNLTGRVLSQSFIQLAQLVIGDQVLTDPLLNKLLTKSVAEGGLKEYAPYIETPNSTSELDSYLALKIDRKTSSKDDSKVQVHLPPGSVPSTLVPNKGQPTSLDPLGSLTGNAKELELSDNGVSTMPGITLSMDGSQMHHMVTNMDVFGVHDAVIINPAQITDAGQELNKSFIELHQRYSMIDATSEAVQRVVSNLTAANKNAIKDSYKARITKLEDQIKKVEKRLKKSKAEDNSKLKNILSKIKAEHQALKDNEKSFNTQLDTRFAEISSNLLLLNGPDSYIENEVKYSTPKELQKKISVSRKQLFDNLRFINQFPLDNTTAYSVNTEAAEVTTEASAVDIVNDTADLMNQLESAQKQKQDILAKGIQGMTKEDDILLETLNAEIKDLTDAMRCNAKGAK